MRLRTVAILRALEPEEAAETAERCWAAGMDLVELPVQGDRGWAALEAVAESSGGRSFGAGTVLTAADAVRAAGFGASVVVSPSLSAVVIEAARGAGALPLPGVMTPTEVAEAAQRGVEMCKLFPATVVGSGWLGAMQGPFPEMRFIAVGGIGIGNAAEFLRAGACGVAFGGAIDAILALDDPAAFVTELHNVVSAAATA